MKAERSKQPPTSTRYSARRQLHLVDFYCSCSHARIVALVGDFNHWDSKAHPMQRMADGCWRLSLELHHGHHQYVFLVDGEPQLDPRAHGKVRRPAGETQPPYDTVSLIAIS